MGATQIHNQDIANGAVSYSKLAEGTVMRGEVRLIAGTFIPAGWIPCDGKTLGKTGSGADYEGDTYRDLYDIVMALFGIGGVYDWNGLGKVNLPDMRDKMPIGASGTIPLGSSGGAVTHTHSVSGSAVSGGNHSHSLVKSGLTPYFGYEKHGNTPVGIVGDNTWLTTMNIVGTDYAWIIGITTDGTDVSHTHVVSGTAATGGILPPYVAFNWIIRYKGD